MNYHNKYLKYKEKYFNLKKMLGGDIEEDVIKELTDEDLIYLPEEYFNQLKELYPTCKYDSTNLKELYEDHEITYGELEYDGIQHILDHLNKKFNNFIDLGSGRGILPLYLAGHKYILKSVGIELVKERHNDALELKNKLNKFSDQTKKVVFINDDFFNVDLSDYTNNQTLVWINNLMFDDELNNRIFNNLLKILPSGSVIACSKSHSLNSNNMDKISVKMNWNKNVQVFLYLID
jgi:hypothetical protein